MKERNSSVSLKDKISPSALLNSHRGVEGVIGKEDGCMPRSQEFRVYPEDPK